MKTQCPFDIELHREIWEQGYKAAEKDLKKTMIYREITHTIRCDNCGKTTETNAASFEVAREAAERQGWAIISKGDWLRERHYCPVKDHEEDMRLDEGEWLLLEKIGYPEMS